MMVSLINTAFRLEISISFTVRPCLICFQQLAYRTQRISRAGIAVKANGARYASR